VKITQIVNVGFEAGGAERSVNLIANGMRERGHDVQVIATEHLLGSPQQKSRPVFADVLVPNVRGNAARRFAGYFWHQPAYSRVKQAMATFQPDVVHLHTIGEFSPAVLAATSQYRRVLTVHGPEDWTLRLLKWNLPSMTAGAGRLSRTDAARYAYLRYLQRPAYLARLRRIDGVLTPSRFVADAVLADVGRVPTRVLPNGVPLPASAPVPADSTDILFVGRLEPVKGARVLLEAFTIIARRFPDAQLTMVGEGTQRDELEKLAASHGLTDRVRFTGWLAGEEIEAAYQKSCMVVIPSVWPENFPTVALEALGYGRAIIGSRSGGIPELVADGENGLLVPRGDRRALAAALVTLLGDRAKLCAMGEESARRAEAYGVEPFLDQLETYYQEVSAQACAS
jgi:glycosyltransferase involved in cell wall biosynthesis